ncbi:Methyltransferase domain-containing protein [Rhodococcus triatomae]|uniref:Methyltransferase domain-containing protein n=2 Tax=Rhodococcus triatomae TaxID=300028 RepID=A0A1G8AMX8_9NOCA|nr:Methyltransferase domain-containing protein [Rhodococcus triatomae]
MSLMYRMMYRLGWAPWEHGAERFERDVDRLFSPEPRFGCGTYTKPEPGRALDIGCGRGYHAVELARRGWDVTAIDVVERALEQGRRRAHGADVEIDFRRVDITDPGDALDGGYTLLLDVGCYHGLSHEERTAYVESVGRLAAPGASLLMFAFGRGYRGPLPSGTSRANIERRFTEWTLVADTDADTDWLPPPLRSVDPRWFLLVRS